MFLFDDNNEKKENDVEKESALGKFIVNLPIPVSIKIFILRMWVLLLYILGGIFLLMFVYGIGMCIYYFFGSMFGL